MFKIPKVAVPCTGRDLFLVLFFVLLFLMIQAEIMILFRWILKMR